MGLTAEHPGKLAYLTAMSSKRQLCALCPHRRIRWHNFWSGQGQWASDNWDGTTRMNEIDKCLGDGGNHDLWKDWWAS